MKRIVVFMMAIAMISIVANVGQSQQDGIIRVRGTVVLDGDPHGDVSITVINDNTGLEWSTETNDNGTYDILVPAKNNDKIIIIARFDDIKSEKDFIVKSSQKTYEVNFDFEVPTEIHYVKKILGIFYAFEPFTTMIYFILILIAICLILKIGHHHHEYKYKKYKK